MRTTSPEQIAAVIKELKDRGHQVVQIRRDPNRLEVDGIEIPHQVRAGDTVHQTATAFAEHARRQISCIELANRTREAILGG